MSKLWRGVVVVSAFGLGLALFFPLAQVQSQPAESATAEPAAPTGQSYTGAKQCSSCHFKQYMAWKKSKHAKDAWDAMPEKYRTDPECLKCHATGFGQATGFKDAASTPNLTGTSCEACHGPGSKHEEVCKKYANKKKLDPAEEKEARDSIYRVLPQNVCVSCHLVQGHKEHPKYDK